MCKIVSMDTKKNIKKNYYFVYYKCKQYGWKPKDMGGQSTGCNLHECQGVIDVHPIEFQLDCNKKYGDIHETHAGYTGREEYKVISWNKLTKAEYNKYKGHVG
jgi:hypothetical protein